MKLPSFNPHVFAINWCKAWNARDLDALLSHYADSIEFCSPRVAARYQQSGVGDPSGKLVGKAALKTYFAEALQEVTDLRLDLQDVLVGVDACCVVYTRETGAKVAEMFKLDKEGKVTAVQVFYDLVC